ncbi:MAG: hypothetical protein IJ575_01225 [Selenomonadaceae bacterium]|nr:hypothetical protein [Selenomonadaceae bacterium]
MPVSGIGAPLTTMRQLNVDAMRTGKQVTGQIMEKSSENIGLPNLAGETKMGTGELQVTNNQINDLGTRDVEMIMERDDQYTEVSNFGNESAMSPSGLTQDLAPQV